MQYLFNGFFPLSAPDKNLVIWNGKVQPELWPEIAEQSKVKTYRELANDYQVSYEAIRRILNAASSK